MIKKRAENVLIWKTQNKDIEIENLKQLLDILVNMKQEDIDTEIKENLENLLKWLEKNFPKQMELIEHLKSETKEFTPQQIRERIVRDLRKVVEVQ